MKKYSYQALTLLIIISLISGCVNQPSFSDRWDFTATLDKSSYQNGDNMTLTVNLTCIIDHSVKNYNPGWFRWISIHNSSDDVVWHPFIQRLEIIYGTYEFEKDDSLGPQISVFQLGPTEEIPAKYGVDPTTFDPEIWDPFLNYWIPALPKGSYYFIVDLEPTGISIGEKGSVISVEFEVE